MRASDAIDTVLQAHANEHPNVAEYLRLRQGTQAALRELWGPPDPEAVAWAKRSLGVDDTPDANRAHAEEIVERLTGSTPETAAYAKEVDIALTAALAWAQAVSGVDLVRLREALRSESIMLRARGVSHDSPASALIRIATAAVLKAQTQTAGAAAGTFIVPRMT